MTTDHTIADALVADARRAVHEALVVLPAPEADRVRSLIADLETAVEGRTAMRFTSAPAAAPSADPAALRDSIAAALYERERPPRDPHWPDVYASDREVFEAMADAVLPVLPAPADRAAVLQQEAALIRAHCPDHLDSNSAEGSWMTCHCDVAEDMERRMAVEARGNDKQDDEDICAHCGQTIRRVPGTLASWWVHDPGGITACQPEQAASSHRATPKAAVVRAAEPADTQTPCGPAPSQCDAESGEPCANHEREQAHAEGEHCFCGPECDKACTCASAGDAFVPAGHYADCPQVAEAQQDGAQDRG
ncbi:MAG: hypothetical protein HOV92_12715 [Streptomyces sp.]|nr:hypothetical protein [Streptomyces sp.]